ncbi:MAG: anti-sigma factor [Paracoccaceae bacterium]|nr:anti-sigma factor [Paracoccaceae bacterium]
MTDLSMKLSAYLDGELDPAEAETIEALLESDPVAQTELDDLLQAQVDAQDMFDAQLRHPVPLALVRQIKDSQSPDATSPARPIWGAMAASLVALTLGGVGGFLLKDQITPTQTAGWLADIADYHSVYSEQERHLVEVGADESDHIEKWLGNTIGATFSIPSLSEFNLTFQGGRLLVANGKPVAQLMYRQEDGTVIALCLQSSSSAHEGQLVFNNTTINGFDFVSWRAQDARYVLIGPEGHSGLNAIASQAALEI